MFFSLHGFTRTLMEFLSRRVRTSFPEQGVTSYSSYTLQRCVALPMRDLSLVAQPSHDLVHTSLVWAQYKIQANHCPSPRPCIQHNCCMSTLKVDFSPYKTAIP